jgi:IS5 family transposase
MMPGTGKGKTASEKQRDRARFRRRAAVEPVIGHLKSDYLMLRNYLKGVEGDMINTIMAAVAFNMMKRLRQIRNAIYFVLDLLTGNWSVKYATVLIY